VAMASLLASPISWTHHWVWVLLIPALMPRHRTSGIPRPVRIMLRGLLALTIVAPYWWFSHGILADAAEAVLPTWTGAVLLIWSVTASVTWRKNQAYRLQLASNAVRTISPGKPAPPPASASGRLTGGAAHGPD
jgi:hypothetical protein